MTTTNLLRLPTIIVFILSLHRMTVDGFFATSFHRLVVHGNTVDIASKGRCLANYRYHSRSGDGRIVVAAAGGSQATTVKQQPLDDSSSSISSSSSSSMYSDLLPNPHPSHTANDVVMACMDTFVQQRQNSQIGLDVCFAFSNDRCRAAIGGNIYEFYQYATNPTFAYLTSCVSYQILSMGPIITGTAHRGAMQTILMEVIPSITTSMTASSSSSSSEFPQYQSQRAFRDEATERVPMKSNNNNDKKNISAPNPPRRFLWTLQQERRPPLQNCWMIHEVLYTKNAFQQTL